MEFFSSMFAVKPKQPTMPLAVETGRLLKEVRGHAKALEKNVHTAELNVALKLAMLEFKGIDCANIARITDISIGPTELADMTKKAVRAVTKPLRALYMSHGSKKLEQDVETLISGMQDVTRSINGLARKKDKNSMLALVCSMQMSIEKLIEATESTTEGLGHISDAAATLLAETELGELDRKLAAVRVKDIPTAPTTRPTTRKGGKKRTKQRTSSRSRATRRRCATRRRRHTKAH
jgi:uncharacterized phage infection (PIP) family protein YhgE